MTTELSRAQARMLRKMAEHEAEYAASVAAGTAKHWQSNYYAPRGVRGFTQCMSAMERRHLVITGRNYDDSVDGATLTIEGRKVAVALLAEKRALASIQSGLEAK